MKDRAVLIVPNAMQSRELLFCPMQGPADGAFVDTPFLGDLGDGPFLEIVGDQRFPLQGGQLLLNDPLDPLQLDFPGKPWA